MASPGLEEQIDELISKREEIFKRVHELENHIENINEEIDLTSFDLDENVASENSDFDQDTELYQDPQESVDSEEIDNVAQELSGRLRLEPDQAAESDSEDTGELYERAVDRGEQLELLEHVHELHQRKDSTEEKLIKAKQKLQQVTDKIDEIDRKALELIQGHIDKIVSAEDGRKRDEELHTTYAIAWEYFATAFLQQVNKPKGITAEHCGRADDKGADVLLRSPNSRLKAVVQVKLGKFFSKGKGNQIVLCLVGSCVYYGAKEGVVFSNESDKTLTDHTKETIRGLECGGYKIECYFIERIECEMESLSVLAKCKVLRKFLDLLPK